MQKVKTHNVTHFLNVDLDLDVAEGMDELLEALKPAILISHFGTRAGLELDLQQESPEKAIRGFVALVQKLPPHARAIWDKAKAKTLNIGVQACDKPHSTEFALSNDILSLAHSIGADLAFTVYAASDNSN